MSSLLTEGHTAKLQCEQHILIILEQEIFTKAESSSAGPLLKLQSWEMQDIKTQTNKNTQKATTTNLAIIYRSI